MLSTFQPCGLPTRLTPVLNFIKSFPASDTYRMFSASTLASISTLPEVVRLMSMVSRRIRRHFPKTFAPTSPLNWKSRLMIASTFPPNETEREESVDLTSAERELDLRRDPRALMFLALSFLLQLELNSLSGKLELRWMSPSSTSIDTLSSFTCFLSKSMIC